GLPVALKDLIDLAGVPTTACSPMRATAIAQSDAAVTTRLEGAGAVLLGKTATHEWAYGTSCESRLHGTTHNPVAPAHSPGGSSGGSAAAVAAGMVPGALGTDTAGSLRIPAACCGVVGFKPTFGQVSRAGILPLSHSLDHAGPIGRTVADVTLLFAAIADGGGSAGWGQVSRQASGEVSWVPAPGKAGLAGLRLGLPESWLSGPIDPGVAASFQAALTRLQGVGVEIVPVSLPSLDLGHFISRILTLAEGATVHAGNLDRLDEYPPDVRARLELGQFILARDYLLAQQLRTRYSRAMAAAMDGVDLLLTPTQPIPAPVLAQRIWTYEGGSEEAVADALTRFVAPANVTGQPALSLPCGRTPAGLPVGLQLMGHAGGDAALLGAAALIEAVVGG
ncbi:MAG TPA: amidase, partial [Symbiobacteriaceae bacterium]|nr:amidase [Symbiobacteriaceae bacterium]